VLASVVTPTKNSADLVHTHYRSVAAQFESDHRFFEIVYVDDGSSDNTVHEISTLAERDRRVRGVFLDPGCGQQAAVWAGLSEARGDVRVSLDVDLEVPAKMIGLFLKEIGEGADLVLAARTKRNEKGMLRRLGSRSFNAYMRLRTGLAIEDFGCGACALTADLVERMTKDRRPHRGLKHIAGRLAERPTNVPVAEVELSGTGSSYHLPQLIGVFRGAATVKVGLDLPPHVRVTRTHDDRLKNTA